MGYNVHVDGEIAIDPPLTWREIKDSQWLPENAPKGRANAVKFKLAEEMVETDDGTLTRRTAVAIVPLMSDAYRASGLVEAVQAVMDAHGDGHTFTGRFDCDGEDAGDLWRVVLRNGRASKVKPYITWPDEEI